MIKNNKILNITKFIISLLSFFSCTHIAIKYFNKSYYHNDTYSIGISIFIIITSIIILIIDKNNLLYKNIDLKKIIYCLILTMLFIVMLPITQLHNELNIYNELIILNNIYIIIFIFSIFICLLKIFNYETIKKNDTPKNLKITKIIIMTVFTILTAIYVFSNNTGYYDPDFPFIYNNNQVSNFHTFSYQFLVNGCKKLFDTPYPIIIMQSIYWLYALSYSLKTIENTTRNKKNLIIFCVIQIILLVGFKQITHLWKDTFFSISLYCYILTIINCIININKINKKLYLKLIIFGTIICLFRNGSWLLILINTIIINIILLILKYKKLVFKCTIIGIVPILINFLLSIYCEKVLNGYKHGKDITYTVPIYQVATFINNGYQFNEKEIDYLETLYPIYYWKDNYEKYNGDSMARTYAIDKIYHKNMQTFNYEKLLKLNLKMFVKEPINYLKSLFEIENSLWRMTDVEYWNDFFFLCEDCTLYKNNGTELKSKYTFFYEIKQQIEKILFDNSIIFNIKSRGGFAVYILILCVSLCIYKKQYKWIIPIIPLAIWWLLLFISMPRSLTRYILIFIISWPILFLTILNKNRKNT